MRAKSKKDLWVRIVLLGTVVFMTSAIVLVPQNEKVYADAIGIPMVILILWLYYETYYELRDNYLYCRSGPFYEKIQYDKGYITGTTYISPKNREEFLSELILKCHNLEINVRKDKCNGIT